MISFMIILQYSNSITKKPIINFKRKQNKYNKKRRDDRFCDDRFCDDKYMKINAV